MKVGIVSLGCCKNLVDTQNALSFLKASGHTFVDNPAEADAIIVNTCGFINDAKQESINTILQMAEYKKEKLQYLIVMGCLVQRYKADLEKELPEVDCFIAIDEYKNLPEIFNKILKSKTQYKCETIIATYPHTAYLKIADGCSNRCAYCAIPLIRKDYRSVPMEDLLKQAKELEKMNVKELNLIAQDTTRYGIDLYGKLCLADLLTELNKMNFTWIRILYMYPDEITDELLDTMSKLDKVVPYFDIPVQHSSDRLLKLMNRRGNKQHILSVIQKIREKFEDPILRTTIIVGFPTETDADFAELLDFVKEVKWDRLGAFTYSLEEDTPSYTMEPKVSEETAQKRLAELMKLQEKIAKENNQRFVGQTLKVVVETQDSIQSDRYEGRAAQHAPDDIDGHVRFNSQQSLNIGDFVDVTITSADSYDLFGQTE
ncbi:MAG: 30S ribosomal protein S12 methylthiotransferase RimO [Erysipelotrichia bacterium]|nr:30S ribosomal protein S12 methylthiotransferase RimO [Erysipelotrichia bacterium]